MIRASHSVVLAVSTFVLAGCGTTIGGAHITLPELDAGRRSLTKDFEKERARGTPIFVAALDVVGFWCPDKEHREKCTPLDAIRTHWLESILRATLDVLSSAAFRAHASADNQWFPTPGVSATLYGCTLLALYPSMLPSFLVEVTASSTASEAASTDIGPPPHIMIPATYLATWRETAHGPADAGWSDNAALIDTFAHEMTHLLSVNDPPTEVVRDGGFSFHSCKMGHVISYKVGHMAECVALDKAGAEFAACMTGLHRRMHVPWITYLWNWTRAFCDPYPTE